MEGEVGIGEGVDEEAYRGRGRRGTALTPSNPRGKLVGSTETVCVLLCVWCGEYVLGVKVKRYVICSDSVCIGVGCLGAQTCIFHPPVGFQGCKEDKTWELRQEGVEPTTLGWRYKCCWCSSGMSA